MKCKSDCLCAKTKKEGDIWGGWKTEKQLMYWVNRDEATRRDWTTMWTDNEVYTYNISNFNFK